MLQQLSLLCTLTYSSIQVHIAMLPPSIVAGHSLPLLTGASSLTPISAFNVNLAGTQHTIARQFLPIGIYVL